MEPSRTSSTAITSSSRLAGGVAAIAAAPTWPCAEMERTSGLMSTQSADGKVPNDSGRRRGRVAVPTMRRRRAPVERPRLGYLCDGCHDDPCRCDEIAEARWQEYGPICAACGGGEDDGYEQCEFGYDGSPYTPGPGARDG